MRIIRGLLFAAKWAAIWTLSAIIIALAAVEVVNILYYM